MAKAKRAIEDVTRRRREGTSKVYFSDAFSSYIGIRLDEIIASASARIGDKPERPPHTRLDDEASVARSRLRLWIAEYRAIAEAACVELASALNVRLETVRQIERRSDPRAAGERRPCRAPLTVAQCRQFEAWEAASRRLEPLRRFVVLACETDLDRDSIESTYERVDDFGQAELRSAVNDLLLAADLADEIRRLLERAQFATDAVYAKRLADEPLVAPHAIVDDPRVYREPRNALEVAREKYGATA